MSVGPRLPRRAALGLAAAGLAAVAGCDDRPTQAPPETPDPDVALVDRVLRELVNAERLAVAAGLHDLGRLHRAHIAALGGDEPTPSAARASAAAVRRKEQRLQHHLAGAAAKAQSGALARLLASMSAAVAQRLAQGTA